MEFASCKDLCSAPVRFRTHRQDTRAVKELGEHTGQKLGDGLFIGDLCTIAGEGMVLHQKRLRSGRDSKIQLHGHCLVQLKSLASLYLIFISFQVLLNVYWLCFDLGRKGNTD